MWFQTWILFSISYMGCHPNPIDELHHFSRWLLHHQPDTVEHMLVPFWPPESRGAHLGGQGQCSNHRLRNPSLSLGQGSGSRWLKLQQKLVLGAFNDQLLRVVSNAWFYIIFYIDLLFGLCIRVEWFGGIQLHRFWIFDRLLPFRDRV